MTASITSHVLHDPGNKDLVFGIEGGEATINKLAIHELISCWKQEMKNTGKP